MCAVVDCDMCFGTEGVSKKNADSQKS